MGRAINRILRKMASPSNTAKSFILESVVRGHHFYKRIWTPVSMKSRGNVLTIENKSYTYVHNVRSYARLRGVDQCTIHYAYYVSLFLRIN